MIRKPRLPVTGAFPLSGGLFLASCWADSDPRGAAAFAGEAMDSGPDQECGVSSIVQRRGPREPAGAGRRGTLVPEGSVKRNALEPSSAQRPKPETPPAD